MVGLIGQKDSVAYTASKGAIISMTRSLALDVAPYGIRANCICPGVVDTPLLQEYLAMQPNPEQRRQEFAALHPLERIGTPTDIARAVLFLASDAAAFITGTILAGRRRRDTRLLGRPPYGPPAAAGGRCVPYPVATEDG